MKKNILVIYPNSFPISGAATNRIISICRGLVEEGNYVKVIINRPTEKKDGQLNFERKGNYLGIEFEYATKSLIWPKNRLLKMRALAIGFILSIFKLLSESRKQKIDILISAGTFGYFDNYLYSNLCKILKAGFIYTIDEYPWVDIHREKYSSIYRKFYLKHFYRHFDGFIVMTRTLLEYYKKLSLPDAKFFHLPMTVELERFEVSVPPAKEEYIAYCGGDPTGKKDGIDILIKAFDLIKEDFPTLKLYIIGRVHPSINDLIENLLLRSRVLLMGFVEKNKVPELLINAKALCLARPDNLQAEGGFPTKLGEYLSTGIPAIITNVGEISEYLSDGINVFLSAPNNIEDFASKIKCCLQNYDRSKIIGLKGKEVAYKHFNYKNYNHLLDNFIETLTRH